MKNRKNEIVHAFLKVQTLFPFPRYMNNKLNKYVVVISEIMKEFPSESKILSIGSGPCDLEAILSQLGYNVTAIDDLKDHWHLIGKNSERIKDFARQMNIELIIQTELPKLKENYFDAVLLIDIIEHLHSSPRELLNYSISALKPSGLLLIETPNTVALAKRLKVLFGKSNQVNANLLYWNIGEYRNHIREYTQSELRMILSYHNLEDVKSKMVNIMIDMIKGVNFVIVKAYKLISALYPNFRDTILISGKKPRDWFPTKNSIANFKKYYLHVNEYNLDNESDDILVKKFTQSKNSTYQQ